MHPSRINDKNNNNNDYDSNAAATIEWDFGDTGDTSSPRPAASPTISSSVAAPTGAVKGAAGIERLEALNGGASGSTTAGIPSAGDDGRSKGAAVASDAEDGHATQSTKSEDAVTPKARGGGSGWLGMWEEHGRLEGATGSGGMAAPGSGGRDQTGSRRRKVRSSVEARWRQRAGSESCTARPAAGDAMSETRETEQNKNTKYV